MGQKIVEFFINLLSFRPVKIFSSHLVVVKDTRNTLVIIGFGIDITLEALVFALQKKARERL